MKGLDEAAALLIPAAADWPSFELLNRVEEGPYPRFERVDRESAELRLKTGGRVLIERNEGQATYVTPRPLSPDELVHPFLAPVASIVAHWEGRESVHAGAFLAGGRVWGVVGDRESGKSSTLACLSLDGVEIVCDDLLVLEGMRVLAGPRAIDLRREPAERLGVGASIGVAGARERWRLPLGPLPRELELGGWIHLAWGERIDVAPIRGGARVARLFSQRGARLPSLAPETLLELASLPSWEVQRPHRWENLDEVADRLRELAEN